MKLEDIGAESRRRMGAVAATATPKASKYRSNRIKVDGIGFHSKKEANRYRELVMQVEHGFAKRFHRQPIFDLPGGVSYRADFLIFYADGTVIYEDVKGFKTAEYKMKKKMVESIYGVEILES